MKKVHTLLTHWVALAISLTVSSTTLAATELFTEFGDYKVYHTVFNSNFIQPDIARAHNLTRAKNKVLVNVAVVRKEGDGDTQGLPAKVSGSVKNLMQQKQGLDFKEVREQTATYYLATTRLSSSEEVLHFNIVVEIDGHPPFDVNFSKKLHIDP